MKRADYIILFTSCVNPDGMIYTAVQDKEERLAEYQRSLEFYMSTVNARIVVVDNSGYGYDEMEKQYPDRLEILSFVGNKNKNRGKGYGEGEIIRYALANSEFLKEENCVVAKVSGRHLVNNIRQFERAYFFFSKIYKNLVFASIRETEKWVVSDFFFAPRSFFETLGSELEKVDDSAKYFFEHCQYDVLMEQKTKGTVSFAHFPFPLRQDGRSGLTGGPIHVHGSNIKFLIKSFIYMLRLDPMLYKFNKRFRERKSL